jgi:hypothetical protein
MQLLLVCAILFAVGFNTPQLAAVKLWQRLEFMVVNPTRTKDFLYKIILKQYHAAAKTLSNTVPKAPSSGFLTGSEGKYLMENNRAPQ